jgi:membrane-bound inhibitor of C-type lysozyme
MMNKSFFLCIAILFSLAGCARLDGTTPDKNPDILTAVYVSEKGETLTATFDTRKDTVTVTMPGGRSLKLPGALSASGARYSDGRDVFWEHHGEGTLWINDAVVFRGKAK